MIQICSRATNHRSLWTEGGIFNCVLWKVSEWIRWELCASWYVEEMIWVKNDNIEDGMIGMDSFTIHDSTITHSMSMEINGNLDLSMRKTIWRMWSPIDQLNLSIELPPGSTVILFYRFMIINSEVVPFYSYSLIQLLMVRKTPLLSTLTPSWISIHIGISTYSYSNHIFHSGLRPGIMPPIRISSGCCRERERWNR